MIGFNFLQHLKQKFPHFMIVCLHLLFIIVLQG